MDIRAELRDLMEKNSYSTAYISTATGLAKSTISMWLNGTYNGKNDKVTDAINNFIQRERERAVENDLPFVNISIVKYISEIARLCHTQGKIGVCVGRAGLGKTVAVKKYTQEFLDSILIESDSGYTAKSLLKEIHRRLGLSGKGSVLVISSTIFTIIFAIALPNFIPIFSAAPPVSSTGLISFLNQSIIVFIGFNIGSIAVPILLNNGIIGCKPSFNPCHIPLKNAVIGFQYL